jgi:O-acetyl-ADP-ribose deacetylase (regulator of RNase III)
LGPRRLIRPDINDTLCIVKGNVARLCADAVACPFGGPAGSGSAAGVAGAIRNAAGPGLARQLNGKACNAGQLVATPGFSLPAQSIFHVGIPRNQRHIGVLRSCYDECLEDVGELGLRSIAFPSLGTSEGFHFPKLQAAHVALSTAREWLERRRSPGFERLVFCLHDEEELQDYLWLARHYFPCTHLEDDAQVNFSEDLAARSVLGVMKAQAACQVEYGDKNDEQERVRVMFRNFDDDGNGRIERDELTDVFKRIQPDLLSRNLDRMFNAMDTNRDGSLDYDEFVNFIFRCGA